MKAVYKKDLKSAFTGMIGWVLCAFVVVVVGLYFTAICLQSGYADFSLVLYNTTFIFLVVVPLLTMRSIVEERRQKTDQLLLTSRASIAGIVWGKYLALVTVYAIPLAIVGICPLVMRAYGSVSLARSYAALLAFFLMGAAAIAIGLFMSSLTENQIIAAVCTFGSLLFLYLMPSIAGLISGSAAASLAAFTVLAALLALFLHWMTKSLVLPSAVFCYKGEKPREEKEKRKERELVNVARDIFGRQTRITYIDLCEQLQQVLDIKERTAKSYIRFMRERDIITKDTANQSCFVIGSYHLQRNASCP